MLSRDGAHLRDRTAETVLALLPYGFVARLGDGLGWLLYRSPARWRIVHINLKLCFPEWSDERAKTLAQKHFRLAIRSYLERGVLWFGSAKRLEKLDPGRERDRSDRSRHAAQLLLGAALRRLDAGSVFIDLRAAAGRRLDLSAEVEPGARRRRRRGARPLRRGDGKPRRQRAHRAALAARPQAGHARRRHGLRHARLDVRAVLRRPGVHADRGRRLAEGRARASRAGRRRDAAERQGLPAESSSRGTTSRPATTSPTRAA